MNSQIIEYYVCNIVIVMVVRETFCNKNTPFRIIVNMCACRSMQQNCITPCVYFTIALYVLFTICHFIRLMVIRLRDIFVPVVTHDWAEGGAEGN